MVTVDERVHAFQTQVEHVDTDASGVLHFARYASLAESAVLRWLGSHGAGLAEFHAAELDLRVRRLSFEYVAPASFGDLLAIQVLPDYVGSALIRLGVRVFRNDGAETLLASGWLEFAVVERNSGAPSRRTPSFVVRLASVTQTAGAKKS